MAKQNYGFQKRQKELNKQKKREEKAQRKLERAKAATEESGDPRAETDTEQLSSEGEPTG